MAIPRWLWEGAGGCPLPSLGSKQAVSSHADLREEPAPSAPPGPVQAEEEAVYEEPPEQETLYEEPPMVGSLQQGKAVHGPRAVLMVGYLAIPWLTAHG